MECFRRYTPTHHCSAARDLSAPYLELYRTEALWLKFRWDSGRRFRTVDDQIGARIRPLDARRLCPEDAPQATRAPIQEWSARYRGHTSCCRLEIYGVLSFPWGQSPANIENLPSAFLRRAPMRWAKLTPWQESPPRKHECLSANQALESISQQWPALKCWILLPCLNERCKVFVVQSNDKATIIKSGITATR